MSSTEVMASKKAMGCSDTCDGSTCGGGAIVCAQRARGE
jgi:hypothetical protein